ncbi:MAG: ABC transporter permease [Acidimicrobiales bacterium]|nr:ABC transporter permease [Acidimicrobiales bacterium]
MPEQVVPPKGEAEQVKAVSTHHIRFSPANRARSPIAAVRELVDYAPFIGYLTRRQLRTTYNRSYLGWIWALLNPIIVLAIYSLVFGVILLVDRANLGNSPTGLDSFPHFLFSGLVFWGLFNQVSLGIMTDFQNSVLLRKKLYFPAAAPAIAMAASIVVESLLEVAVLIAFYVAVGNVGLPILLLPFVMFIAVTFGVGVGLLLAVPNVRYRDVGYLYALFLRLFFYLTPIIWPFAMITNRIGNVWVQRAAEWNPMAKMVHVARTITYDIAWPDPTDVVYLLVVSLGVFALGFTVFNRQAADATEGL